MQWLEWCTQGLEWCTEHTMHEGLRAARGSDPDLGCRHDEALEDGLSIAPDDDRRDHLHVATKISVADLASAVT